MQHLVGSKSSVHKILGIPRLASLAGLLLCLTVFLLVQGHKSRFVFLPDGVHFVDGDCYSRMTRAQLVVANPGSLIRTHTFENYPLGVRPHTTAPMDYLIAGASWLFRAKFDMDSVGAWISPALGCLLVLMAWLWGELRKVAYRWSMLTLLSTSPILVHGFAVGRPDHQSLILLLTASGLLAETVLWTTRSKSASLWWGLSWGCALWVSWFEPLILLALVLIVRALTWRGHCLTKDWRSSLGILIVVGLFAIALEGFPKPSLGPGTLPFFRWAARIGELQSFNPFSAAIAWIGWLSLLAPLSLAWLAVNRKRMICWLWMTLLVSMGVLTGWHARWGYFLALSGAFAMPSALSIIPQRWLGYALFVASFWPVASALERDLFPTGEAGQALVENLRENQQLRQAALVLRDLNGEGILAPWWLTPQLAYWSGKAGLAGTSHESLAGTIATARFFVATDDAAAKAILLERHPDFVVVCSADRLLDNSYTVLGKTGTPGTQLGAILFRTPSRSPDYLRPVFQSPSFKVYQVRKELLH